MDTRVSSEVKEIFEVLNERIRGYEKAAENVRSTEYKSLFQQHMRESRDFENELRSYSDKTPEEAGTRLKGDTWHFWMDIKSAVSSDKDETMLEACIRGEKAAIDKYEDVLEDEELPTDLRTILRRQLAEIRTSHESLQRLEKME